MRSINGKSKGQQAHNTRLLAGPSDFNRVRLLRNTAESEDEDSTAVSEDEDSTVLAKDNFLIPDVCEEGSLGQNTLQKPLTNKEGIWEAPIRKPRKDGVYVQIAVWQCVSFFSLSLFLSHSLSFT